MKRREQKQAVGIRGATAIQFISKYINVGIQLVVTAILARLITPDDYGVLAIVMVFLGFFGMFGDMGIGPAIVQFRDLEDKDFGALFVFSVFLAIALTLLFCAISPLIALIYSKEQLIPLCCLASLSLFFSTLNMVPNGLMLKSKDFASIGMRLVVVGLLSGILGVVLAFRGLGCYALVLQAVVSSVGVFTWNIARKPVRALNTSFRKPLATIFSYSTYQMGFNLISYFARNLDNLLVGYCLGSAALGYYDKAYKLTTYPQSGITSVVTSVVQPFMAEHQNSPDYVFSYWMTIEKLLSLVAVPIVALFFSAAPEIIWIIYGEQWDVSAPLLQALSISVYFQMLNGTSAAFYQSLGRTDYLFWSGLIVNGLTVLVIVFGIMTGDLNLVALFVSVAFCLHTIVVVYFLVYKSFQQSISVLTTFVPEIVTGAIAILVCSVITGAFSFSIVPAFFIKLVIIISIVGFGYVLTNQVRHVKALLSRGNTDRD